MLHIMSAGKSQPHGSIELHWSLLSLPAPGSETVGIWNWSTELSNAAMHEIGVWLIISVKSVSCVCRSGDCEWRWLWVLAARNSFFFFFFSLVFQWFFTSLSVLPGSWEAMVDHLTNNLNLIKSSNISLQRCENISWSLEENKSI